MKALVKYITEAEDGEGPLSNWSIFSWWKENDIKTTDAYTKAVEIHEKARALPLKTPAKCRIERDKAKENELDNEDFKPATKAVVEAMVAGVKEECIKHEELGGLQGKVEILTSFSNVEDKLDQDKMCQVLEDIAEMVDKVSEISSYYFRCIGVLEENSEELNEWLELLILTLRNRVNALEEVVGRVGRTTTSYP